MIIRAPLRMPEKARSKSPSPFPVIVLKKLVANFSSCKYLINRRRWSSMTALSVSSAKNAWDVFVLFMIPIGGGIPAGVVLAQSRGIGWVIMTILYFISDVVLAILFEPMMMLFLYLSKHVPFLVQLREAFRQTTEKTIQRYGAKPGPITLVGIAFGVDPMTGRAAALAAGHGFFAGWAIAIIGDMFFFAILMVSTIWLNNVLGDGTWATLIIMTLMFAIPPIVRKIRKNRRSL